jgi:aldehyde dehydrogenase (NAD+)
LGEKENQEVVLQSNDRFTMTIDGRAFETQASFEVLDPATQEAVALAPDATRDDLDRAVASARAAFPAWRALGHEARQAMVRQIGATLSEHAQDFAMLLTAEQGKPLSDALGEVAGAAYWCDAVAGLDIPVIVNEDSDERRSETRHVPIGVVGAIVPWNYPVLLGIWKIAPALLAGNTMVVKPSPFTPLTMLKLGGLLRDVLPAGVLNVISGGDDLGPWMTAHTGIDKISFTGSTATGKRVMASAAVNLKRVTLELGGNDPAIVLPDVDIEATAEALFWAAFTNSGQICIATKRVYVHEAIYDRLKQAITDYARTVQVGDGREDGVRIGPIQNKQQFERVKALIADSRAKGHRFLLGGDVPEAKGYFIPVTIVDNPPDDSRVVQEEAFGPVLPLLKFSDVEDAIARANDSVYGLGASVWSGDSAAAAAVAGRIEAGTVWVNEVQHLTPFATFGGHKQSGVGVENGIDGLLEYTNPQTITVRKGKAAEPEPAS